MAIKFHTNIHYDELLPSWLEYRDFFEGKQNVMRSRHLIPFMFETLTTEGQKALANRKQRTWYTNYTSRIVLAWRSFFFKYDPDLSGPTARVLDQGEVDDFDGKGTSFLDFIKKEILENYLVYGWPYVMVDVPTHGARTQAEARSLGVRPYATSISPLEIPDWEIISGGPMNGHYSWVHYEFMRARPRASATEKPEVDLIRKELAIVDGVLVSTEYKAVNFERSKYYHGCSNEYEFEQVGESVQVDRFDHIPLVNIQRQSWIKDVVPEAHRYYNLRSSHENILHNSGYQKLAIVGRPVDESNRVWAENTVLQLQEGGNVIAIEPTDPTAIKERLIEIKDSMFALGLNQLNRLPSDSRGVQSDSTIRAEKEDIIALAKTVVTELENYTNTILKDWATFKNIEFTDDDKVVFEKDFSTDDVDQLIRIYSVLKDELEVLPSNKKAIIKKLTSFFEFDDQTKLENTDEIDAASFGAVDTNTIASNLRLGIAAGV